MNLKKSLFILILCILVFSLGEYLTKLYGLDPPYAYLYVGMALKLLALISVLVFCIVFIVKKLKNPKN
ncbi:hypothetical protein SAMN05660477_01192 [Soonwooa buanensis]|uniref:Uncharacterized protein n=1 Tax=Soonwooa buanensis TaxID=619805 RepID=A0A1T5E845_9FLAO|nr:hypothetical protein SAMN05660477_01192 [Soonwooa buanensis]